MCESKRSIINNVCKLQQSQVPQACECRHKGPENMKYMHVLEVHIPVLVPAEPLKLLSGWLGRIFSRDEEL